MVGIRAIKVNNIVDKNLTFKFDGHPVYVAKITFVILLLIVIMGGEPFYFPGIVIIIISAIVMKIINKLSIYSISFDHENILIVNKFKKCIINYRNGIEITINKELNFVTRTYTTFIKESRYRYSLIIRNDYESWVLASVVGDASVNQITNFIENFSLGKNVKKDDLQMQKAYIRFDKKFKDK